MRLIVMTCLALGLAACEPSAPAPGNLPEDPQPTCIKDQPCEQP